MLECYSGNPWRKSRTLPSLVTEPSRPIRRESHSLMIQAGSLFYSASYNGNAYSFVTVQAPNLRHPARRQSLPETFLDGPVSLFQTSRFASCGMSGCFNQEYSLFGTCGQKQGASGQSLPLLFNQIIFSFLSDNGLFEKMFLTFYLTADKVESFLLNNL